MFLVDGEVCWSASDLTAAAECEYATLRKLDYILGRAQKVTIPDDPFETHIAALGDRHEERVLVGYETRGSVKQLERAAQPLTRISLEAVASVTLSAFASAPDVVYQPAFFDGEFFGYADFVERTDGRWLVCDAKLARSAKPKALLQLAAYADQIDRLGLPVSSTVSLLLGSGERADFPLSDVLPVFVERRDRLRRLLAEHRAGGTAVHWGDDRYVACGHCSECKAAVDATLDVILVAGLRMEQRRKLRAAGIVTIGDLAVAPDKPEGMTQATFDKLRAQAALQWTQMQGGAEAPVTYELTADAAETLGRLPAPSEGDLFFDFEGDPMYDEGDLSRIGLEYLWGMVDVTEAYTAVWAHSSVDERSAFVAFIDMVAERRARFPDMHIYHYAAYETSALKRLAMRYQTREEELDDLLRAEIFVDLYATVRGAVRVSQPSYSIKKLEPLYMGDLLRESDVADGAGSVVAYAEYREMVVDDPAAAAARLASLADYNAYDCLSTLRLRDWLLGRAAEIGVRDAIVARSAASEAPEAAEADPLFVELMARSGPELPSERSSEQQAYAMLASALGFHNRESKLFWWAHFERLTNPIDEWTDDRDVFIVEDAEVTEDWHHPGGKARNLRRIVRLVGDWVPGSRPGAEVKVVYRTPAPSTAFGPERAPYAACAGRIEVDPADPRIVVLTESRGSDATFDHLPVAIVPSAPPPTGNLESAVREISQRAADAPTLPALHVLDVIARRAPRMTSGGPLPGTGVTVDDIVAALIGMSDSYVAVQGPPGTGKTYSGSRVVKQLVEQLHWRVGVVAQSHAVVENMLAGIVSAGLEPSLVGKDESRTENDPPWKTIASIPSFLAEHVDSGCVVGGTAWDFANAKTVERDCLDLLVIDEAGQFALASTLSACVAAKRLLLLGDPQQLPQVSQASHAEPVDESALGWLMDGHHTIPSHLGYFLEHSYRMHPDLCTKVSTLSYDNRLVAAPEASVRLLDAVPPGLGVVAINHTGNRVESSEEAAEVVAQVRALLGATWINPDDDATPRPLGQSDFVVVAPYNAQVACIRHALDDARLDGVRVGTVDKFQGREAPIAIVSMTASSHGDVPRGMGFLLNRNRVNVAVSRAQWRAVLIRSDSLTSYMPATTDGLLELGSFIGLCSAT